MAQRKQVKSKARAPKARAPRRTSARRPSGSDIPLRIAQSVSGSDIPLRICPIQNPGGESRRAFGRKTVGMGWSPDIPDTRDRSLEADEVQAQIARLKSRYLGRRGRLPGSCDHSGFCSPIDDQGPLGSCTAHAVIGMMEYLQRRSHGRHVDLSRLFLYRTTRRLLGLVGDTGAYIRSAIKSAAAFGVPPEAQWPYILDRFDEEPDAYLYAFADNFSALNYARLDAIGTGDPLEVVKRTLAAGFGVAFGFTVYDSISNDADIPFPDASSRQTGGHAVMAVGYDDDRRLGASKGALLIRNSWGADWGEGGYGWLPYAYVEAGLARDFWTLFKQEWLDERQFE